MDYFPYGKILRQYIKTPERYVTTGHERDAETGLDYRGARFYDSDVARFLSLDPLAAEFSAWSDYNYVLGNPVMFVDPDGKAPSPPNSSSSPVSNVQSSGTSPGNVVKPIVFAIKYPYIASQIGTGTKYGLDISGVARRFGQKTGKGGNTKRRKNQITNAARHMNWQGAITQKYGRSIAKEVGFAHENKASIYKTKSRIFSNENDADSKADILNNVIGRNLGAKHSNLNSKDLALKVLDYQKENGFWVVNEYKNKDNSTYHKVEKVRLTEEEYSAAKENINELNTKAFTPKEQAIRDNMGKGINSKVPFKPLR